MTGELFEIIFRYSLVGAIASSDNFNRESFLLGVKSGNATETLLSDLFTLRASVLLGHADSSALHSQLSGMLIGREIREGTTLLPGSDLCKVTLVGSEILCSLYETALRHLGISVSRSSAAAAIAGFQHIANGLTVDGS